MPDPDIDPADAGQVTPPAAGGDDPSKAYFGPVTRKGAEAGEAFQDRVPTIKDEDGYAALKPGSTYVDPEGQTRRKQYTVSGDADYDAVPEGESYVDPQGQTRQKPKYEPIDFTAQTLYDMSVNDKERRKALERSYPGKVKETPTGELYVEDEGGKMRKPGHGAQATGGFLTSQAAPVLGSLAGELVGGAGGAVGGSAVPLAGTVAGGVAGGIAGAAAGAGAGQAFNDAILQLAGVYDRTGGEEAENLGFAAGTAGAGSAIGRGVAGAYPYLKGKVTNALPALAARISGATEAPEGLETAIALREKGVLVPPSMWAPELPHVINVAEAFDPAFRTQKPLMQSATRHYEDQAKNIIEMTGATPPKSVVDPTAAVPTKEAGEIILRKTLAESAQADAKLQAAIAARKTGGLVDRTVAGAQREALSLAAEDAQRAAQALIDQGYQHINQSIEQAARTAGAGHNSGDLWQMVGDQLVAVRRGVQERANTMYNQADQLAEGHLPNVEGLPELAEQFANELPEDFQRNQPGIVRQLRAMAGERDPETGEWIREPAQPTFGQLHNLRSQMRSNADWYRLNSDIKNGTYKFFANRVDDALHDPAASPELQAAAGQLDRADAFYRENMRIFEANNIKAITKGLEAGEPADPNVLYKAIVKEGHTDLTNRIRNMIGPNLWAGVRAADMRDLMQSSMSKTTPDVIDGSAFSRNVLDRYHSGVLETVHGREVTQNLLEQVRRIAMLDGKLDIPVRPGDTVTDVIQRARLASDAAKAQAKADPLKTLNGEMRKAEQEAKRDASKMRLRQKQDPLGFLYDITTGASEAVDRILNNEDLILAAEARFGRESPEFNALRQVWVQRILRGTLEPGQRLGGTAGKGGVSEEVQRIMFPGVRYDEMKQLAKEMTYLVGVRDPNNPGKSMAATAKVEHPWSGIAGKGGEYLPKIPGFDAVARMMLGKYFKMVTDLSNSPALMRFVQKGLKGDPAAVARSREVLQRVMQKGGVAGAAAGESIYQTPTAAGTSPIPVQ